MRLGLVGFGIASGNGAMNSDICRLSPFVTKWLIPNHPKNKNHEPYIDLASNTTQIYKCNVESENLKEQIKSFFLEIDAILYVEHPIFQVTYPNFNIVEFAHLHNKKVFGIPMWEWWPRNQSKKWMLETDALWAVTAFTNTFLNHLSTVLDASGFRPYWYGKVYGDRWGVNLNDFKYVEREFVDSIVFINGNGGYKNRKASDVIIPILSKLSKEKFRVKLFSQVNLDNKIDFGNIEVINKTYETRNEIYEEGSLFVFTSYWEGLCHGIYEACATGAIPITTDAPPMNECVPSITIPVLKNTSEKLNEIVKKSIPSQSALEKCLRDTKNKKISENSKFSRQWIVDNRNLEITLNKMYTYFTKHI